jgi:hypothetical protein
MLVVIVNGKSEAEGESMRSVDEKVFEQGDVKEWTP